MYCKKGLFKEQQLLQLMRLWQNQFGWEEDDNRKMVHVQINACWDYRPHLDWFSFYFKNLESNCKNEFFKVLFFNLSQVIISTNSGPPQGTIHIPFSIAFWPRWPFSQQFFWITYVIKRHRFSSSIINFTRPFIKLFNVFGASSPFALFSLHAGPLLLGLRGLIRKDRGCKEPKENRRKITNFTSQHTETYWLFSSW